MQYAQPKEKIIIGLKCDFVDGNLRCGCQFGLKLSTNNYIMPKDSTKHKRKRPDYVSGCVTIKSFNYDHTNDCVPSQQQLQFCCSRSGIYISKIPVQVYWQLCSIVKKSPNQYISSSTIKSRLSGCFPSSYNITKQDVFNTRIRCKRLM